MNDPSKSQLKAINKEVFVKAAQTSGLEEGQLTNVWNMFESTMWGGEDFLKNMEPHVPEIRKLVETWEKSGLARLTLTTVGIAIGYANLVRVGRLEADLGIWIK